MCGRYRLTAKERYIRDHFGLDEDPSWTPRYNIAPTQRFATIRQDAKEPKRTFGLLIWRWRSNLGWRYTKFDNVIHRVSSHCKPWRDSSNDERLNGENGLLLTPSIDHLLDRGFIGFEDSGELIISPVADLSSIRKMGIDTAGVVNVGAFTSGQKLFLDFHRNAVLLKSVRS